MIFLKILCIGNIFQTEYASKDENIFLKRVWRKFHRQELTLNTENATIFYF